MADFDEPFDRPVLDETVWTPAYLPAWSSRRAAVASYRLASDGLHLSIPDDHPLWCPELHQPPLRVSAVQSANWSGPLGSLQGQQPFADGLVVREEQRAVWGFVPRYGRVEVEMIARIDERSMFSAWMVGIEDRSERCGEICLVEVFGDCDVDGSVAVGTGIHALREPALAEDFAAVRQRLEVDQLHRYAVDWQPGRVDFFIDDEPGRSASQAPDYPMQLIIGVFDFPSTTDRGRAGFVPEVVVRRVRGWGG